MEKSKSEKKERLSIIGNIADKRTQYKGNPTSTIHNRPQSTWSAWGVVVNRGHTAQCRKGPHKIGGAVYTVTYYIYTIYTRLDVRTDTSQIPDTYI